MFGAAVVPPALVKDPELFIVGEAPGEQEIKRGKPFVGPSGTMLDLTLKEIGLRRDQVSVSNVALCRPAIPDKQGRDKFDAKSYMVWLKSENARVKRDAKRDKIPFKPVPSPFTCCRPRLLREIAEAEESAKARGFVNGVVISLLGNFAVQALLGKVGIMKQRGSVNVIEKFE